MVVRGRSASIFALLLALLAPLAVARPARAYGDPASDVLNDTDTSIFLPHSVRTPKADSRALAAAVESATKQGFPIRVAVLATPYDLGSLTMYWHRPRQYATVLATEISPVVKGPLLTVMPNGLGFSYPKHPTVRAQAMLESIDVRPGASGLARAATTAVGRLRAIYSSGTTAAPAAAGDASRNRQDRLTLVLVAAGALAALGLARLVRRRLRAAG